MPVGPGRYRVKRTSKGPIRLHFTPSGKVNEAKNLKTGDTSTVKPKAKAKKR